MATWSVLPSPYDKRDASRQTRKVCATCGRTGWHNPRERQCKRIRVQTRGMGKFTESTRWDCMGTLTTVQREKTRDISVIAERKRQEARRKQRQAERRISVLSRRIRRLQTAITKQQRNVNHYARLATRTDAEIAAARERIKTAQQVQVATRRLLRAAGVPANPFTGVVGE